MVKWSKWVHKHFPQLAESLRWTWKRKRERDRERERSKEYGHSIDVLDNIYGCLSGCLSTDASPDAFLGTWIFEFFGYFQTVLRAFF